MLLIISSNQDHSTDDVIDWLIHYEFPFFRINAGDAITVKSILGKDIILEVNGNFLELSKLTAFWYRKGRLSLEVDLTNMSTPYRRIQQIEISQIEEYLIYRLEQLPSLGSYYNGDINKMKVLDEAKSIGLATPTTLITSKRDELLRLSLNQGEIITKAAGPGIFLKEPETEEITSAYTTKIVKEEILEFPSFFFPSLFQNKIDKLYELRVFYLAGKCYAIALFSQDTSESQVDFRSMDVNNPFRIVPYNLTLDIEEKIDLLMKKIGLNTGSLDFVVDKNGELVFLEVNPVGQFNMVSTFGNYHLEEKIALYLQKISEE